MNVAYLQERIEVTKSLILIYEDAVAALGGGAQSYTLDTGQTRTTVTKSSLKGLHETLDGLYNRLAVFEARLNGSGSIMGVPAW